jgi:hypothetical protein
LPRVEHEQRVVGADDGDLAVAEQLGMLAVLLVGGGQAPGVEAPPVQVHQIGTVAVVGVQIDARPGARPIVQHDAAQRGVGARAPVDVGQRA